jgi:coproporphyrinogen III oxidase-like Fe-S oxidoreductase
LILPRLIPSLAGWLGPALFRPRQASFGDSRLLPPLPRLLYLHIPFCRQLCPFCSFVRYPYEPGLAGKFFGHLKKELDLWKSNGAAFSEVYVGGGSPGIDPDLLEDLLGHLRSLFPIRTVSVETNPDLLDEKTVRRFAAAGIDRLSVGIQSLDDSILATLGRLEKYGTSASLVSKLREFSRAFRTVNADMIFHTPGQTIPILQKDIDLLLSTGVNQATFYPLMTAMRPSRQDTDEKKMYDTVWDRMSAMLKPVSVWCFGGEEGMTDEYVLRHRTFAGAGCSAFGRIGGGLRINAFRPEEYGRLVDAARLPVAWVRKMSPFENAVYDLLTGLFGLSIDLHRFERDLPKGSLPVFRSLSSLLRISGWAELKEGRLGLTRTGRYPWLVMMKEFFQSVNHLRSEFLADNAPATGTSDES